MRLDKAEDEIHENAETKCQAWYEAEPDPSEWLTAPKVSI